MANLIVILAALAIVGSAAWYVHKQKKQGVKCIGCPSGGNCSCCSGCGCAGEKT